MFFNTGLSFTPEVIILCKGSEDGEFLIYLFIHSNKLAYFQLIIVFGLGKQSSQIYEQGYLNF